MRVPDSCITALEMLLKEPDNTLAVRRTIEEVCSTVGRTLGNPQLFWLSSRGIYPLGLLHGYDLIGGTMHNE